MWFCYYDNITIARGYGVTQPKTLLFCRGVTTVLQHCYHFFTPWRGESAVQVQAVVFPALKPSIILYILQLRIFRRVVLCCLIASPELADRAYLCLLRNISFSEKQAFVPFVSCALDVCTAQHLDPQLPGWIGRTGIAASQVSQRQKLLRANQRCSKVRGAGSRIHFYQAVRRRCLVQMLVEAHQRRC